MFTAAQNAPHDERPDMPRASKSTALAAQNAGDNTIQENTVTETAETPAVETTERVKRTPAERAQLRLDTARKRQVKAQARLDKLTAGIAAAEKELNRAVREVEFRLTDEDLPEQPADAPVDVDVEDVDVPDTDVASDEAQAADTY